MVVKVAEEINKVRRKSQQIHLIWAISQCSRTNFIHSKPLCTTSFNLILQCRTFIHLASVSFPSPSMICISELSGCPRFIKLTGFMRAGVSFSFSRSSEPNTQPTQCVSKGRVHLNAFCATPTELLTHLLSTSAVSQLSPLVHSACPHVGSMWHMYVLLYWQVPYNS